MSDAAIRGLVALAKDGEVADGVESEGFGLDQGAADNGLRIEIGEPPDDRGRDHPVVGYGDKIEVEPRLVEIGLGQPCTPIGAGIAGPQTPAPPLPEDPRRQVRAEAEAPSRQVAERKRRRRSGEPKKGSRPLAAC